MNIFIINRGLLGITSLILINFAAFSQDTIVKNNGEYIECTVLDVNFTFVKCSKFNSQEETIYRIVTDDILKIVYMNGETTIFIDVDDDSNVHLSTKNGFFSTGIYVGDKKLNPIQVRQLYDGTDEALSKYNSGRTFSTIGNVIALPSAFIMGYQLGKSIGGGEVNKDALAISGICTATGMIFILVGDGLIKKSVKIYNSEINSENSVQLNMGFTTSGIGLCLSF